ncbi:MAG: hypothetical protein D6795_15965, partial [Deltaproteobacteria bacterium]
PVTTKRFLEHFGITVPRPDLAALERIVAAFSHLPYENLTKVIRKHGGYAGRARLRLPAEVIESHIRHGTGGTCFSLTYCLWAILETLGFVAYPIMAEMNIGENVHCTLVVLLEGRAWMIDPGYLLGRPLPLPPVGEVAMAQGEASVILRHVRGKHYDLHTVRGGVEKWRYRVRNEPVDHARFFDYWEASFDLPGLGSLLITQRTEGGQRYVRNRQFQWITSQGRENRKIAPDEYEATLARIFGIAPEIVEEARALVTALQRHRRKHALAP